MPKLKVVASTNIWHSMGDTPDFPIWKSIGCREYIIGYTVRVPSLKQIGDMVGEFMHILEGKRDPKTVEIFTGYEIYKKENLTHNEFFQLKNGDEIDYPAQDITKLDEQE